MSSTAREAIDPDLWEATYRTHAARLTRLATVLVGPDSAHDLVADTVLHCIRRPAWAEVVNPGAYLTTALVHAAQGTYRRDGARRRREAVVGRWPSSAGAADVAAEGEPAVVEAIDRLSPAQAAIVYLLYWEDLTIPDTARQLGITEGSVRKQLDRAKRRLRKEIDDASDR